jgi:hypothetical protein
MPDCLCSNFLDHSDQLAASAGSNVVPSFAGNTTRNRAIARRYQASVPRMFVVTEMKPDMIFSSAWQCYRELSAASRRTQNTCTMEIDKNIQWYTLRPDVSRFLCDLLRSDVSFYAVTSSRSSCQHRFFG